MERDALELPGIVIVMSGATRAMQRDMNATLSSTFVTFVLYGWIQYIPLFMSRCTHRVSLQHYCTSSSISLALDVCLAIKRLF